MSSPAAPNRVLVIQLRRLGDVLLTSSLLDDLHTAFPSAQLDFLVGAAAAPVLDHHPLIHERIIYDRSRTIGMWREIRSRHYDWIVDVQSSPRTAQLVRLSGARVRVGWRVDGWGWVYTHRLTRKRAPEWVVRERERLLELVGVPPLTALPRLTLTESERRAGQDEARALGLATSPYVGLLLSAGEPSREWRVDGFAELAERLHADGVVPLVFLGTDDQERAAQFRRRTSAGVFTPEALPLRRFLGLLAGCRAFVSGDTGPAHMATALGVPRVTLYGPSPPATWNPGLPTTPPVFAPNVPCLGCCLNVCPIGHDCMRDLSAERVHAAVRALLVSSGGLPARAAAR